MRPSIMSVVLIAACCSGAAFAETATTPSRMKSTARGKHIPEVNLTGRDASTGLPTGKRIHTASPTDPCQPSDPCRTASKVKLHDISATRRVRAIPTDPCTPGDPCRESGKVKFKDFSATKRLDKATPNLAVRSTPTDPCAPGDPCRSNSLLQNQNILDGGGAMSPAGVSATGRIQSPGNTSRSSIR